MTLLALAAREIHDGERVRGDSAVLVSGDRVVDVVDRESVPRGFPVVELGDAVVAPGLVDIQVNGGADRVFPHIESLEDFVKVVAAHRRSGSTSIVPTLITSSQEVADRFTRLIVECRERLGMDAVPAAHLEGPFISRERRGIHESDLVREPTSRDISKLIDLAEKIPLLVTLAPEIWTDEQIASLTTASVVVSLGHSNCSYDRATSAIFDGGASSVTHLFNAMTTVQGRQPGLVGAAILHRCPAGLIYDRVHVSLESAKVAVAAGALVYLVSDCLAPVGGDANPFDFAGRTMEVREGACLDGEGNLGGSSVSLHEVLRNSFVDGLFERDEAICAATSRPADVIRNSGIGRLRAGAAANMVVLDSEDLALRSVWVAGKEIAV